MTKQPVAAFCRRKLLLIRRSHMSLANAPEIPIREAKAENIFDLELLEDQVVQLGLEAGKFGAICLDLSRFRDNSAPQLSLLLVWFCRPLVQTLCSLTLCRLSI